MQKGALLVAFGLVLTGFINLVSAAYYGSFYGCGGSLSCWLDVVDPSWVILGGIFIISFGMIGFALSRSPLGTKNAVTRKPEATVISNIIALVVSFFIIYGINKSGFDYEGIWYNFFFFVPPSFWDFVAGVVPLLLLGMGIFLGIKYGFKKGFGGFLIGSGIILVVAGFFSYEGVFLSGIGVGLILIGALIFWKT